MHPERACAEIERALPGWKASRDTLNGEWSARRSWLEVHGMTPATVIERARQTLAPVLCGRDVGDGCGNTCDGYLWHDGACTSDLWGTVPCPGCRQPKSPEAERCNFADCDWEATV